MFCGNVCDVQVGIGMMSREVIVGIGMTSLPVFLQTILPIIGFKRTILLDCTG